MPKTTCSHCLLYKKEKFFPDKQPYVDRKVCDKCIAKSNRSNETMVKMLKQRSKQEITKEEEEKINLSFDTVQEMKEVAKNNPKSTNILKDLEECTNVDVTREHLSKLNLSKNTLEELTQHFITVASVNARAKKIP